MSVDNMLPAAWAGLHYEELDIPLLLRGPGLGDLARQRGVAMTGSDTARYAERTGQGNGRDNTQLSVSTLPFYHAFFIVSNQIGLQTFQCESQEHGGGHKAPGGLDAVPVAICGWAAGNRR
jgi:hypothetical protein